MVTRYNVYSRLLPLMHLLLFLFFHSNLPLRLDRLSASCRPTCSDLTSLCQHCILYVADSTVVVMMVYIRNPCARNVPSCVKHTGVVVCEAHRYGRVYCIGLPNRRQDGATVYLLCTIQRGILAIGLFAMNTRPVIQSNLFQADQLMCMT